MTCHLSIFGSVSEEIVLHFSTHGFICSVSMTDRMESVYRSLLLAVEAGFHGKAGQKKLKKFRAARFVTSNYCFETGRMTGILKKK